MLLENATGSKRGQGPKEKSGPKTHFLVKTINIFLIEKKMYWCKKEH